MVSSLAEQLARSSSLNSNLLHERARKLVQSESYLFAPKEARQHDLEALHALGLNGFIQLKSLQPSVAPFEQLLFSDAAKVLDRTLQPLEQNEKLDASIAAFLPLLGPFLLDAPTGKVLEWLVRRFRIHEFNVDVVVRLFLPYHESPHFIKIVSILHIKDRSPLRFLQAYKTSAKPLHRPLLINEMLKGLDVARFVSGMLPTVLQNHWAGVHRGLIAFHTGLLLEFIGRSKSLDENAMTILLPAALDPLQIARDPAAGVKPAMLQESILGSYLLLAAISQKTRLTPKAVQGILVAVTACAARVSPKQLVRTYVSICAAQDQLERLPSSVVKTVTALPDIETELIDAMAWAGAEKFLVPLLESLFTQLDDLTVSSAVETLLTTRALPSAIVRSAAVSLIQALAGGDVAVQEVPRLQQLLSHLHQRHPKSVEWASTFLITEDETKTEAVEQVILTVTVAGAGTINVDTEASTLIVGSTNADSAIRVRSVREMLAQLSNGPISATELQSISSALLLRVHDSDATVLTTLYTSSPEASIRALLTSASSPAVYFDVLKQALHGTSIKTSRDVIRAHLSFLLTHFLPAVYRAPDGYNSREYLRQVAIEIIMPFLLFTKPRMKTAQAVWEILGAAEDTGIQPATFELLGGCVEAIRWEQQRPGVDYDKESMNVGLLTKINLAVAAKIADNILASNHFQEHLDSLLEKLRDENQHARALAYLITRALLSRLNGEQRIDAAHRVLLAMQVHTLDGMGDFMRGVDDVSSFLSDTSVGTAAVLKPSSVNTIHRLQVALLSAFPSLPRPAGVRLDWLASQSTECTASVTLATRYVALLRDVYRLSNSSVHLAQLSTYILRMLFSNLGDETLAFLTGVWLTAGSESQEEQYNIQYAALRHATAFLEAHVTAERTVDFQTAFPAMVVMLQSPDASVREAATKCIAVVVRLSSAKEPEAVYAFDAIYGTGSSTLQYLDWADFQRYTYAIGETRANSLHDPDHLQAFHTERLGYYKTDSKKNASYKERVLCFLLSHVNSCPLVDVKAGLLKSLDGVSNEVKAQVLVPTLEALLSEQGVQDVVSNKVHQDLATYAVSAFDATVAPDINDPEKTMWTLYERVLLTALKNGHWERPRAALVHRLQHGLFAKLSGERQVQLCLSLLRIAAEDETLGVVCKKILLNLLTDVSLILRLLFALQPSAEAAVQPASKRARVEKSATNARIEDISVLAVLAEVISSAKVAGSLELVSALLETLNRVILTVAPDATDRRFIEQLLMSAVENVVHQFPAATIVPPGSIRVDTLIEILRTSENPQSFHQASLLMASLALIAPDAVLYNVMPIFTFMGSNVFHRDDTYSFRVVQKTVDSIVPVMVSSLKEKHGSGMDLYRAAREFLRVFTSAANHVPRHRRVNFFSHLVDTLGPADFLAPVNMLLVDRVANRVVRQNPIESAGSLFLPLAVCERYPANLQLPLYLELIHEVERLTQSNSSSTPLFLENAPDDEHPHAETLSMRRAVSLLVFCDHALQRLRATSLATTEQERTSVKALLSSLLGVTTAHSTDASYMEVATAARSAMNSTLGIMSAPDFVMGILTILQSSSSNAQAGALDLLSDRLTNIAEKSRRMLTPTIVQIVDKIRSISSGTQENLTRSALRALAAVNDTLSAGEESSVTSTVPLVLDALRHEPLREPALRSLLSFSSKLGPRAIPYLKDIVKECVLRARASALTRGDLGVAATAAQVLRNLLTSIPTFWGESEVLKVVELYLDSSEAHVSESAEVSLLVKAVAKHASPTVLLPALCNMWDRTLGPHAKEHNQRTVAFVQVVKVTVKAASRPAVLENLRELFKTFLSMFDLCANSGDAVLESAVTTAFLELVVKLNETAFRPIFRKMFDWAFTQSHDNRRIVFCHVYSALLDFFKALMVPYMSFTLQSFMEILRSYSSPMALDGQLWLAVVETLSKAITADEDRAFWRSDKLRQLVSLAAQQVPVAVRLNLPNTKDTLAGFLVALLGIIDDNVHSKALNLDLLMHSRSEDARVRLLSLTCAEQLWQAHGEKLLGFVAETATFIAEAAEDENDVVVQEAHSLKAAVEAIGGSIDVS
ncbi:hypothetical protein BC628DRAFT_1357002 [Trametes gibbosa]|nr:hypothetical protein BC628DRAFT_1357002 [Trametes gibbosa]